MSYSGGIVSKPVTTHDIGLAIGSASRDVGTLCTNGNINDRKRFNLHKPTRYNKTSEMTDAEFYSANCGLDIPYANGVPTYNNDGRIFYGGSYHDNAQKWNWLAPRGMSYGEWFRMLDFNGFRDAPIPPLFCEMFYVPSSTDPGVAINVYRQAGGVDLTRFASFQNCGLGVLYGSVSEGHMHGLVGEDTAGNLLYPLTSCFDETGKCEIDLPYSRYNFGTMVYATICLIRRLERTSTLISLTPISGKFIWHISKKGR